MAPSDQQPPATTMWLLVIAHPDDESMFFIPTLRNLLRGGGTGSSTPTNNDDNDDNDNDGNTTHLRVLCLSNGDYENPSAGPIRTRELKEACSKILGTAEVVVTTVLDDVRMKDGPNEVWNAQVVSNSILNHIQHKIVPELAVVVTALENKKKMSSNDNPFLAEDDNSDKDENNKRERDKKDASSWEFISKSKRSKNSRHQPDNNNNDDDNNSNNNDNAPTIINLNLLTFDQGGVSGHPNHIDVFKGVCHLLNEKCSIELIDKSTINQSSSSSNNDNNNDANSNNNDAVPTAKLWMSSSNNASSSSSQQKNENITIELNVKVYTLQTISNPLYKYFLWIILELFPLILFWILRVVWQIILFLLGGGLIFPRNAVTDNGKKKHSSPFFSSSSSSSSRILPSFAGMTSTTHQTNNKTTIQCNIMEPMLVWQAMAAHHSQFVWYRRLSVLFSRYTYLNDLHVLSPDAPITTHNLDDEDDNALSLLPPIAIVPEEGEGGIGEQDDEQQQSSPTFLLTTKQMNDIRQSILPPSLHHRPWKRIYSVSRDGDSFIAFQKRVGEWNAKQGGHCTILVVKTTDGEVIGGYASVPFVETVAYPSGSASGCCLFKTNSAKRANENDYDDNVVDDSDVGSSITVYGKSNYASPKRIVFDATRRIIAFGGGNVGGEDEGFGLCLDDGFSRGSTAKCEAFGNEPLVSGGNGGLFDVLDVEVWGFVFGQI